MRRETYSQERSGWNCWIRASITKEMTSESPHDSGGEPELADVAAFADGSLPEGRRSEVAARIAASPRLAMELERQRAALRAVEMAAAPAPQRLRRRIEAMRRPREQRRRAVLAASG